LTYTQSADSTIGVGTSATGAAGSFSASGNTGMSIPYINFNASSETGYSTSASVTYSFNGGGKRHLCGINSGPGGSDPLLLEVKP
jgi:hypothetical protein